MTYSPFSYNIVHLPKESMKAPIQLSPVSKGQHVPTTFRTSPVTNLELARGGQELSLWSWAPRFSGC